MKHQKRTIRILPPCEEGDLRAFARAIEEARAILAPVLSHIWVRDRAVYAVTPTRAFEVLLVGCMAV